MIDILIDDVRDGSGIICRTFEAAVFVLRAVHETSAPHTKKFRLVIDHDLGNDGDNAGKSGYDVLMWAVDNNIHLPAEVYLVSSNPVGRKRMEALLVKDLGYTCSDPGVGRTLLHE